MKKKYDWNALKTEFVTSDISAAALSKKHGIHPATLYRHYQIERWQEARQEYLGSVMEKCADKAAYIAAIKLSKELDIANKLSGILDEAVSDKDQFRRYLIKEKGSDGTTVTEEQIFNKIDMKSLGSAIKALESLEQIKSVMYGIVSPLDERKLQIEEAKHKEKQDEENEKSGVVILPDIKEEKG
ncbi:MAG: hypothetical protein IKA17_04525 [Clostridia bacterium]|nr:hypothetical protein [Clostridia bacterium]